MSLSKSWKLVSLLFVLSALVLSGCAGSKGSGDSGSAGGESTSSDNGGGSSGGAVASSGGKQQQPAAPKEEIDENKLKKTQDEAMDVEKDNHELRRQIFEAKNKLGIPVEQAAEE